MPVVTVDSRSSAVAHAIRTARLIVVLRRVSPQSRLRDLVDELADAGASVFEITFDADAAGDDLAAVRERLTRKASLAWVGAGTIRSQEVVRKAVDAGATFGVSPVLDLAVMDAAREAELPFMPGAYTPTEADAAWRAGATFVKLFPASSLGPAHVRELRGPLPEIEVVVTGGVDASNALAFLEAGAVAVGIGSALVRATPAERRQLVRAISEARRS